MIENEDLKNYMGISFISNEEKKKPSAFEPEAHKYNMSSSYFTMMYGENFINSIMQCRVQKENAVIQGTILKQSSIIPFENNHLLIGLLTV